MNRRNPFVEHKNTHIQAKLTVLITAIVCTLLSIFVIVPGYANADQLAQNAEQSLTELATVNHSPSSAEIRDAELEALRYQRKATRLVPRLGS